MFSIYGNVAHKNVPVFCSRHGVVLFNALVGGKTLYLGSGDVASRNCTVSGDKCHPFVFVVGQSDVI